MRLSLPPRGRSLLAIWPAGILVCLVQGCADRSPRETPPAKTRAAEARWLDLVDVTAELGLDFVHRPSPQNEYPMPTVMGAGGAVFDADGDGDLDLFLVGRSSRGAGSSSPLPHRLYLQEQDGVLADATRRSGLGAGAAVDGMGCAVGDVDNDGDLDLYVTRWGEDVLYLNDGDGEFSDGTAAAGLRGDGFSASAVFFDYDRDGWLDLYVTRYVDYRPERRCTQEGGRRDYCGPTQFPGESDLLWHNEGGGRFSDRSRAAGISSAADAGLGVVAADFDDDGWIDLYVANDADPNQLWRNLGDGTFVDEAVLLGVAYSGYGVAEAGMGVAVGDADEDGDLDLFVSHLIEETSTYYENLGGLLGFEDRTAAVGLAAESVPYTGFGTAFFDADNDGDLDLGVVQGGVKRRPQDLTAGALAFWGDYAEPNLLFENRLVPDGGSAHFTAASVPPFGTEVEVSRGLVPADLDADGDLDLVITNLGGPSRVYRNVGTERAGWIEIRVEDPALRREALGARVTVFLGERRIVRHAIPYGGYLTSGHPRIHLGLGTTPAVDAFEVRWPDGLEERFDGAPAGSRVTLERGEGQGL